MNRYSAPISILLSFFVVGVFSLYLVVASLRKDKANSEGYDLDALRRVRVLDGGRIKPLDTVARTTLRIINGSEEYEDDDGKKQPAIKWLADAMFVDIRHSIDNKEARTGPVWQAKVFRIDNEQLVGALGLKTRPGLRYSLAEFFDHYEKLMTEVERAENVPEKKRDLYQVKVLEFSRHLGQFQRVSQFDLALIPPSDGNPEWQSIHSKKRAWLREAQDVAVGRALARRNLADVGALRRLPQDAQLEFAREVQAEMPTEAELDRRLAADPEAKPWMELREAYRAGNTEKFNELVASLPTSEQVPVTDLARTRMEVYFNKFAPFYKCMAMYIAAIFLSLVGLLLFAFDPSWSRFARWPALGLTAFAFAIHTAGIIARIYLQGRPPVTNLYSSAIFIGWGAVLTCMVVELIYSYGVGNLVGAFIGFGTCVIAHMLSYDSGDTMEMMQAVLDTNFWLATHVTCVTFGYVATYVAGIFGISFILIGLTGRLLDLGGVRSGLLDRDFIKALANILYGVVCFATMLSFVGTVLGGIWADQSWGRFWGWDPKENGAVLVVIWNTIILHARWAGLIQQRGLAAMTVLGNIVTTWSWFGTNMLGVGLHAYGFTQFGFWMMVGTMIVCIPIACSAMLLPRGNSISYREFHGKPLDVVPVKTNEP